MRSTLSANHVRPDRMSNTPQHRLSIVLLTGAIVLGYKNTAFAAPYDFEVQADAAAKAAAQTPPSARAKNVILFIGDGMSISTITAARIFQGQLRGEPGEENSLAWDHFEHSALSKTYNTNQQTPDSAGTMTAMITGHKTKAGIISYDYRVVRSDHTSLEDFGGSSERVETLFEWAEDRGLATGIVTTAKVTHATPACCYAHVPNRDWENNDHISSYLKSRDEGERLALEAGLQDIAAQLVAFSHGDGIDVVMGGGRANFFPKKTIDPKTGKTFGNRLGGSNLVKQWLQRTAGVYVDDRAGFESIDPAEADRLLGLFDDSHMDWEADRLIVEPSKRQPSLAEMSVKGLQVLRRNEKGFVYMIEGGRIDHAHHNGNAYRALMDTVALSDAVEAVLKELTPSERAETLIVVTADHSHVFNFGAYATRGNPILGKVIQNDSSGNARSRLAKDQLGLPFTAAGYLNGPGFTRDSADPERPRPDLTDVDTTAMDYKQEATVPMSGETHGGEDVAIYATGPGAILFRGTREQNYIYHAIREAMKER